MSSIIDSTNEENKKFKNLEDRVCKMERSSVIATGQYSTPSDVKNETKSLSLSLAKTDAEFSDLVRGKGEFKSVSSANGNATSLSDYMNSIVNAATTEVSMMRQLASVQQISNDSAEYVIDSNIDNTASWEAEGVLSSTLTRRSIKTYELFSQPKVTQKLIDDPMVNVEEIVARKIAENFARKENAAFLLGDGQNKPKGLLTYANGLDENSVEQITGALSYASIASLIASLDDFFRVGSVLLMNPQTEQLIRNIKDNNGQYIYTPANASESAKVLGIDVAVTQDMPAATSGNLAIVFANMKYAYQVIDSGNVNTMRDPFTEKPFVKFYTIKRTGGSLLDGRAAKILKIS